MDFREYQRLAVKTAIYPAETQIVYPVLGLASEAGEVAGKVKKYMRDGGSFQLLQSNLLAELGDVLWYVAAVARDMDLTLEEIAQHNIDKLRSRMERNVLSGSGDNR